jgi:hypothetical protein
VVRGGFVLSFLASIDLDLLAHFAEAACVGNTQYLVDRARNSDPRRTALEVFRGKASLRLHRGPERRIFAVFLDQ